MTAVLMRMNLRRRPKQRQRHGSQDRAWWWRDDRGSATTEITLIIPVLIMILVFIAVVVHRGVDARLRLADAAHQAARAASLERIPHTAVSAAQSTAARALSSAGIVCPSLTVDTSTNDLAPGGTITVTVACPVDVHGATLLGIVGPKRLSATATEPIDVYRSTTSRAGTTP